MLDADRVEQLFEEAGPGYILSVDLEAQTITTPSECRIAFDIGASRKTRLLNGLDDIDLSLQQTDEIRAYETARAKRAPWLFNL